MDADTAEIGRLKAKCEHLQEGVNLAKRLLHDQSSKLAAIRCILADPCAVDKAKLRDIEQLVKENIDER